MAHGLRSPAERLAWAMRVQVKNPSRLLALSIVDLAIDDVRHHRTAHLRYDPVTLDGLLPWLEVAEIDPRWVRDVVS